MRRPVGWDRSFLGARDGPFRRLDIVPATRPWTERDDQDLFDATLRGESIADIAKALRRGYEETKYRLSAHSNAIFIDSKLPEYWMLPYSTMLKKLERSGCIETEWSEEEEEELMLFVINGQQWIDPLVFADDRTVEGMRWRMEHVTRAAEPHKSRFEALKRREEKEQKEFQAGMSDQEWLELGMTPPARGVEEEGDGAEAGPEGCQGARTGGDNGGGKNRVVVVIDD